MEHEELLARQLPIIKKRIGQVLNLPLEMILYTNTTECFSDLEDASVYTPEPRPFLSSYYSLDFCVYCRHSFHTLVGTLMSILFAV